MKEVFFTLWLLGSPMSLGQYATLEDCEAERTSVFERFSEAKCDHQCESYHAQLTYRLHCIKSTMRLEALARQ